MKTLAERIAEAQATAVFKSVMDDRVKRFQDLAMLFLQKKIDYQAFRARAEVYDLEQGVLVLESLKELGEALFLIGSEPSDIERILHIVQANFDHAKSFGCDAVVQIQFFRPLGNRTLHQPSCNPEMPENLPDDLARDLLRVLIDVPERNSVAEHIVH